MTTDEIFIQQLIAQLSDSDGAVRDAAATSLEKTGDDAVPMLAVALRSDDRWTRWYAARTLGRIGNPIGLSGLTKTLNDRDSSIRLQSALAMGAIGEESAIYPLLNALNNDRSVGVRWAAANSLAKLGQKAIEPLTAALENDNISVRWYAAQALDQLGWQPTNDTQRAIYLIAKQEWDALNPLGEAAVEALKARLEDTQRSWMADELIVVLAAEKLEQIGTPDALASSTALVDWSLGLEHVLQQVMDTVIQLTKAERGFLVLKDQANDKIAFRVARGMDERDLQTDEHIVSRTIIRRVAESGEPVLTTNASEDPRFRGQQSVANFTLRSILAVPLTRGDDIIGVIYVDNRLVSGIFDDEQKKLLTAFSKKASEAIAKAHDHGQS
ncbi:MAG: GAF domain-containing protein [Chloroflexi bacterium]|nr:MAG: GAF domain-containing protein [Chloroflexota bacterium]